ncbi:MAG: 3-oxoacid CoA-transferase subunit B [Halanaerobiaceae bacterium]
MTGREKIASRIAQEFKDGDLVNLGIGMPTMVANYISEEIQVLLQSENGFIGLGPNPEEGEEDPDLTNAGGQPVTIKTGGCFFDSISSFSIIRGGHLDATVLGALEVDQEGNLANWMIPGKLVPGMGGAMDLTVGARKVIVASQHLTKKGKAKLLKKCTLPLTAKNEVDLIVTELAVLEPMGEAFLLKERARGISVEKIIASTEGKIIVSENLKEF